MKPVKKKIEKGLFVALIILLTGLSVIIYINNDFLSNVRMETRISTKTVKSVTSLGILAEFFLAAYLLLLIFSISKKEIAITNKARITITKRKKAKRG